MYSVLNKFFNNSRPYDGLIGPDNAKISTEAVDRMRVVQKFITDLGSQAGIKPEKLDELEFTAQNNSTLSVDVKASDFEIINNEFRVPQRLLIDLKKDIAGLSPDEELMHKLDDLEWFKKNLVEGVFGHELGPNCPNEYTRELRDNYHTLIRDVDLHPEKTFNIVRFAVLHELGHFDKNHGEISKRFEKIVKIGNLVSVVGIGFFISRLRLPLARKLLVGSISLPLTYKFGSYAATPLTTIFVDRPNEFEADRFAATAISGEEGKKICQGGIDLNLELLANEKKGATNLGINRIGLLERLRRYCVVPNPYPEERIRMLRESQQPAVKGKTQT